MSKSERFFLIIAIFLNYSIYAFNLNFLFSSHKQVTATPPSYLAAKQNFEKYCIKKKATYGFQIICTQAMESKPFKFDISTVLKCKQKIQGINSNHHEQVLLPLEFIKKMKPCRGAKVFGPDVLHTTNILEVSDVGTQQNKTETFYDIICYDEQNYLKGIYKNRQSKYDANLLKKLSRCEASKAPITNSIKYTFSSTSFSVIFLF